MQVGSIVEYIGPEDVAAAAAAFSGTGPLKRNTSYEVLEMGETKYRPNFHLWKPTFSTYIVVDGDPGNDWNIEDFKELQSPMDLSELIEETKQLKHESTLEKV